VSCCRKVCYRIIPAYTSQNLLGTIFRVTFAVLYRRIWSIVGNYSILCCDKRHVQSSENRGLAYCNMLSSRMDGIHMERNAPVLGVESMNMHDPPPGNLQEVATHLVASSLIR
jgi:hypothetical protein